MSRSRIDRREKGGYIDIALVRLLSVWRSYPYQSKTLGSVDLGRISGGAGRVGVHSSVLISRIAL